MAVGTRAGGQKGGTAGGGAAGSIKAGVEGWGVIGLSGDAGGVDGEEAGDC